jgi:hypothetical protein
MCRTAGLHEAVAHPCAHNSCRVLEKEAEAWHNGSCVPNLPISEARCEQLLRHHRGSLSSFMLPDEGASTVVISVEGA